MHVQTNNNSSTLCARPGYALTTTHVLEAQVFVQGQQSAPLASLARTTNHAEQSLLNTNTATLKQGPATADAKNTRQSPKLTDLVVKRGSHAPLILQPQLETVSAQISPAQTTATVQQGFALEKRVKKRVLHAMTWRAIVQFQIRMVITTLASQAAFVL